MQFYVILACYCVLIVAASLTGGLLPWLVKLTHRRMQLMMSFVGGLMLGVAMLHLLPHAVAKGINFDTAAWWALGDQIGLGWSALVVAAVWAIVGAVMYSSGRKLIASVEGTPETIATLKKIPETLKTSEDR